MLFRYSLLIYLGLKSTSVLFAAEGNFSQDFKALVTEVTSKPYLAPQLDFSNAINRLKNESSITEKTLDEWQQRLMVLMPETRCDKVAHESLAKHLEFVRQREKLKAGLSNSSHYQGSFEDLPDAKAWYLHWLETWLMDDVTPSNLKDIAHAELRIAFAEYQKAKKRVIVSDAEVIPAAQHSKIVEAFQKREALAKAKLQHLLSLSNFDTPLNISASGLPEEFPAPGIYDNQTQTFLYHPHGGVMNTSHFDWLYIHEGIPGHHLQFNVAKNQSLCATNAFAPIPFVSSEGWAAYVETLGKEIGLYQQPSSEAYALEWRVLRALRVMIDIGIHFERWPDEKAQTLWLKYLPDQPNIMQREIKRIKNWPAQVITYVYGKHLIEKAIEPYSDYRTLALNRVLRLSNQMPVSLSYLEEFMPIEQNKN